MIAIIKRIPLDIKIAVVFLFIYFGSLLILAVLEDVDSKILFWLQMVALSVFFVMSLPGRLIMDKGLFGGIFYGDIIFWAGLSLILGTLYEKIIQRK